MSQIITLLTTYNATSKETRQYFNEDNFKIKYDLIKVFIVIF